MRDGRVRVTTSHRLHPSYIETEPRPAQSRGLTPMNVQGLRSRMRRREVSERKQVGDAESLLNEEHRQEHRQREEDEM